MKNQGEVQFIGVVERIDGDDAKVRIYPEFCAGLRRIEQFSHLNLLYWFHLRDKVDERRILLVFPRRHAVNVKTGVFACRSPSRPNPIGFCVVEQIKRKDCVLIVKGLDAVVGSPIIDIKPYLPRSDTIPDAHVPEWTTRGPTT